MAVQQQDHQNTERMPGFEGITQGVDCTATCRLPIGKTYEQLLLIYSGVTLAQMTEIRLMGDGKPFISRISGADLDMMNQFQGRAAANGILILDFNRFGIRTRDGEERTGLGTGIPSSVTKQRELQTLQLEIDIDAAATAPALVCKAVRRGAEPLGMIKHIRKFTYSPSAAGDFEIADLPKGHLINSLFFQSGDVNSLKVSRNNFVSWDRTDAENRVLQGDGARVPQTDVFVFDPNERGNATDTFQTAGVHDLRFTLDMAQAGTLPVIAETIAPLV